MEENLDLSKALEKVQDMLSSEDGQNQLSGLLGMLGTSFSEENSSAPPENTSLSVPDLLSDGDMLIKIQKIMTLMKSQKNNPRTDFLKSLGPLLKTDRRMRLEKTVRLMNMLTLIQLLRQSGEGGD